jgi:hypothetical protein
MQGLNDIELDDLRVSKLKPNPLILMRSGIRYWSLGQTLYLL